MKYYTVYDVTTAGYTDGWILLFGAGMLALFSAILWNHISKGGSFTVKSWWLYVVPPFAVLWIIAAGIGTYVPYLVLHRSLELKKYTLVEGTVQNFVPGDSGDHTDEQWDVESHGVLYHYHYNRSELSPGFRQTQVHGGPIHEGLKVRIADVAGAIARLEIAR